MKFLLLGAAVLGLSSMASAQENVNDGHTYAPDAETGITCKSKWIIDRVHTPDKFLDLPFIKEAGTKPRTAVVDSKNKKIYIGYSKPVVVDFVSNDYAHLVVFDLETGKYEGEIALTCDGVPVTGLMCANQVGIDDAGNLWFCGMYRDVSLVPAQIYVVTNRETGECKNVGQWALPAEESDAGGRCDLWDVVGDITGETSNAVCMAAVSSTTSGEKCCLYRWELAQGAKEWVANEDDFAGYVSYYDGLETYPVDQTTWGSAATTVRIVAEEGHVGSIFYVDGFTTCPSLYNTNFEMVESFASAPDLAPATGPNGIEEFTLGGKRFIAYVEAQYNVIPGCRVNICQIGEDRSFEGMRKYWSLPETGLGEVSDGGTRIHSIDTYKVVDKNGKEGIYLLTYKCNNGIGLYLIAEDGFEEDGSSESTTTNKYIEIDEIIYQINKETADAKVYKTTNVFSGILEIPSQVDFDGKTYTVTEIGDNAFNDCSKLTTIVIPNTISTIGNKAFNNCSGLQTIISLGATPPACVANAFDNYNTTLYVPKNSFAQYFIDDVWGLFNDLNKIETCATSLTLNKSSLNLNIGNEYQLNPTISPSNTTIKNVIWKSENPEIATVDDNGIVTGVSKGTTNIIAKTIDGSNISSSCFVAVGLIPATSIKITNSDVSVNVGENTILKCEILPLNTTDKSATWLTSDSNIASISVNNDGSATVTGISTGTATIFAITKDGSNLSASCKVSVLSGKAEGITLSQSTARLKENDILTLSYTILPSNTVNKTVTWSTSDQSVAAFRENNDGSIRVVGVSEGVAVITATTNDGTNLSASCKVIVSNQPINSEKESDGHIYEADAETGITCKSKWIIDRVHTPDKFLDLPFIKEAGPKARTAVIDTENSKIYIGYSKPVVTGEGDDAVSNDYAHLVVFDLETGKYEGEIALTCDGVPVSGLLCANQVGIDDAGNLWFCGMYSDVSLVPAQIYVVTNRETGECKNVGQWALPAEESDAGGRCDFWDVVGDITGETSNAVCMAAVGSTTSGEKCCIYRWELAQGAKEWVANEDSFAGYVSYYDGLETYPVDQTTWGSSATTVRIVAEEGHVGSIFYVDGFTTCPSLYNTNFEMVESFASAPDLAPATGCNGVNEFFLGEVLFLVYAETQYNVSPGCRINVCQFGEGMTFEGMRKYWSLPEAGLGEVSDGGTRIHNIDVTVVDDENGKQGAYIFSYKCNNGLALYCVAEDGFNDKYPTVSNIEKIEIDESFDTIEYFNLQGIRVDNPKSGFYIKKEGNKVSKIFVK